MAAHEEDDQFRPPDGEDNIFVRHAEGRLDRRTAPRKESGARVPWVTRAVVILCALLFIGLNIARPETDAEFERWGLLSALSIWEGRWWGLVTCTFLHYDPLHALFNMYWLWVLGGRLESRIGSLGFALFYLASGAVGAAAQLALTDSTGIGASGAVYGIFGFLWIASRRNPDYAGTVDQKTVTLMIAWFFLCFFFDYTGLLPIANAAHTGGLGFGVVAAYAFAWKLRPALVGLYAFVPLVVLPLVYAPWSTMWLRHKAWTLHDSGHTAASVPYYERVLAREPSDEWARNNLMVALRDLGREEEIPDRLNLSDD